MLFVVCCCLLVGRCASSFAVVRCRVVAAVCCLLVRVAWLVLCVVCSVRGSSLFADVCCSLFDVHRLMFVGCCLLMCVVCRLLFVVCWLLVAVRCLWLVVRCV